MNTIIRDVVGVSFAAVFEDKSKPPSLLGKLLHLLMLPLNLNRVHLLPVTLRVVILVSHLVKIKIKNS